MNLGSTDSYQQGGVNLTWFAAASKYGAFPPVRSGVLRNGAERRDVVHFVGHGGLFTVLFGVGNGCDMD